MATAFTPAENFWSEYPLETEKMEKTVASDRKNLIVERTNQTYGGFSLLVFLIPTYTEPVTAVQKSTWCGVATERTWETVPVFQELKIWGGKIKGPKDEYTTELISQAILKWGPAAQSKGTKRTVLIIGQLQTAQRQFRKKTETASERELIFKERKRPS